MKKIIYSLFVCLIFVLGSCQDKTSEDVSKITYYVTYKMNGDQTMLVPIGTPYVEPGVKAMEGTKDVTATMKTTGTVDPTKIGLYPITYSSVNADGFASSAIRQVVVCDPTITTDISGTYTSASGTNRLRAGATVNYSGFDVTITKIAPGFFYVSDFWAGYYYPRLAASNYTSSYTMTGYISLKNDNKIDLVASKVAGWGDSLDNLNNGVYTPLTNSLYWEAGYAGSMTFYVTLNKK